MRVSLLLLRAGFLEWLLPLLVHVLVAGPLHHPPVLTSQNMAPTIKLGWGGVLLGGRGACTGVVLLLFFKNKKYRIWPALCEMSTP